MNGEAVPTEPSGKFGLVSAQLPAGQYEVTIQFDQTPLRRVSDLVSILALAVLGAGLVAGWRPRLAWLAGPGLAILLVALVFYAQGPGKRLRTPTAAAANFDNRVHLLGYQLDKTTWRPGEELVVRLYYYVEQAPLVNYKLFLHVAELDDSGKLTQIDAEPMFNFSPTTRWDAGEFVFDQVRLPLAADLKPGRYRLVIGLYAPETVQNLPVLGGGAALPGDRAALGEVEIAE